MTGDRTSDRADTTRSRAAFVAVHRLVTSQLLTRARVGAVCGLSLLLVGVGVIVSNSSGVEPVRDGAQLVGNLGLAIVVPVVALLFASAALGDLRDDKTLVYLWLSSLPRWVVPVAATAASATVVLPAVVVPSVVTAAVLSTSGGLVSGTLAATLLGGLAYNAVFVAMGLLTRRTLVWGIAYILIWEGFVAGAGAGAARFALRAHTRSILADSTGTSLRLGDISPTVSITVLVATTLVATLAAVRRYATMTVD
jgi:ABC-2 type transport system permease protein